jgi:hypothetical protein
MELGTLYEYYGQQNIAPTFADLRDEAAVDAYQSAREILLGDRLALPIPLFRGAEILEYGPDTGENALVFARLGSRLTLVEPARTAHAKIRAYFERFAPPHALRELLAADVLGYQPDRRFDMIVAEGFIYTVQPSTLWLTAFQRALVPGGLALISYIERSASLFELLLRVPFAALRRRAGNDRVAAAELLYGRKWARIPHTRSFASWVMDVLDNPFMRLRYFIDARELVEQSAACGLSIHSAWPMYRDGLENVWIKHPVTPHQRLERTCAHLGRSVLTFALGTKAYLVDDERAAGISRIVGAAVDAADALIDADDAHVSRRLAAALRELATAAREARRIVDPSDAFESAIALLDAWADVASLIARGALDGAITRLNEDPVLLDGWGAPTHLAVLRADRPQRSDASV